MARRLSSGKDYRDFHRLPVWTIHVKAIPIPLSNHTTIWADAVSIIICVSWFSVKTTKTKKKHQAFLAVMNLLFCAKMFTVQCCCVSSQVDGLILRLVLVKATMVEWVRLKQSAPLCLSCFGSWWTLKTNTHRRWLMSPMNSVTDYMLKVIKSTLQVPEQRAPATATHYSLSSSLCASVIFVFAD